jgi:hypothetical protein
MMLGLKALELVITEQPPDRPSPPDVTAALRRIKHPGVTGDLEFDERGNLRNPTLMVYEATMNRLTVHGRCASGACPCRVGGCTTQCCRRRDVRG